MGDAEQVVIRVEPEIGAVAAADWDGCAPASTPANPFVSHAFLKALDEKSIIEVVRSGALGCGRGEKALRA